MLGLITSCVATNKRSCRLHAMLEIHLDLRLGIAMMMQLKAAWQLASLGKTDADFGTLLIMNYFAACFQHAAPILYIFTCWWPSAPIFKRGIVILWHKMFNRCRQALNDPRLSSTVSERPTKQFCFAEKPLFRDLVRLRPPASNSRTFLGTRHLK